MKQAKKILTLIFFLSPAFLNALEQISQDNSGQSNFAQSINTKAYDRYEGTLYVATGTANATYSVARATRAATYFEALATADAAKKPFDSMALINNDSKVATHVALHDSSTTPSLKVIYLTDNSVLSLPVTSILDSNGAQASSFSNLAGSNQYAFLRIHGSGGSNTQYSGVLTVTVDGTNALAKISANAVVLDNQRGNHVLRTDSNDTSLDTVAPVTDMYWDPRLELLYISSNVTSQVPAAGNNYFSALSFGKISNGALSISDILPDSVNPAAGEETIFATNVANGGSANNPIIYKVRVMKTSTGRYYVIINGSSTADFRRNFYAFQVASSGTNKGQIVKNDNDKTEWTDGFTAADLELSGLLVGGDPAPWTAANGPASDIDVVGDCVYVSFDGANRNNNNDPGIWSSQAMFDNNGTITCWTAWQRAFPSVNNDVNNQDKTYFFSVDGRTGKIWQIRQDSAEDPKVVARTKWDTSSFSSNALSEIITSNLSDGCTAVLDLPKDTPSIGKAGDANDPDNALTLFGGVEKVSFARTTTGNFNTVITDFSAATNHLLTTIPADSGIVRCLGYSRKLLSGTTTQGYFFAGTDTGLYVYAKTAGNNAGFDTSTTGGLTDLSTDPFDGTSSWMRMASSKITGPVTQIESDGRAVYLIEQDINSIGSLTSNLWRIILENDVNSMTSNLLTNTIVKSGTHAIPSNTFFTGIKFFTDNNGQKNRALLTTNTGIYYAPDDLYEIVSATAGNWTTIDSTRAYQSLFSIKRIPTTDASSYDGLCQKIFSISLYDSSGKSYYQNSAFRLLSSNRFDEAEGPAFAYAQQNFTNADLATGTAALSSVDRTLYFYSDGGRRFYSSFSANHTAYNNLYSFPYYGNEWNIEGSYLDGELTDVSRVHWIENISGNGQLLAGTDSGVIALE